MVAQTHLVKATAAIEGAVLVTMLWLAIVKPSSGRLYTISEELKSQVKKMGGFFQLLIQVNTNKLKAIQRPYKQPFVALAVDTFVEKSAKSYLKIICSIWCSFDGGVADQNAAIN